MSPSLDSSTVAILDGDGNIQGTGFVASERLVITCAHVLNAAGAQPGAVVAVRFHLNGEMRQAEVALWDAVNDLATLSLSGELPDGVAPVGLGDSADAEGQPFRAFGYPDVGTDGLYADGTITGRVRGAAGQDLLQVKSSQLARGFSGGPVLVGGKVIGVVTAVYHADRTLKNFDTAWAIPAELIPHTPSPPHTLWPLGHSFATSPNFTGRADERGSLGDWMRDGPTVLVVRALGGFGKSALAWHRGRGEGERDCISQVAEQFLRSAASRPGLRGRVLITTRLRPRVLEGHDLRLLQYCREIELTALSPADAVAFFHAEGVRGARAEIEAACAPYGYHPLSLRLLAGLIVNDLRQPGDIVAAGRLDVSGDQKQRQHHVLEQAYNSLTPERRQLLSTLACFRNPMTYEAIAAIADLTPRPPSLSGKGEQGISPPRAGEGLGEGLDSSL